MNNEVKNLLEELYSFAQYLQIKEEDIPNILGVKGEILNNILNSTLPSHAIVKAISVLHDILETEIENDIIKAYEELYLE